MPTPSGRDPVTRRTDGGTGDGDDRGAGAAEAVASERRIASVERATDVLFCLERAGAPKGVTAIASELGISKAVVHRILTSLMGRDLVVADSVTRLYSLGPAVLRLAASYRAQLDVRVLAMDTMRDLVETTAETSTLSILHDGRRVYVDQVTPKREVKMTVEIGSSFPLHAGASSKAFLAWLPEELRREHLRSRLAPLTDATITDPKELARELSRIREQGFAVSMGERQQGAGSVAAPLFDEQMKPIAVLSVCGPLQRFNGEVAAAAAELVKATRSLSRRMGAPLERP